MFQIGLNVWLCTFVGFVRITGWLAVRPAIFGAVLLRRSSLAPLATGNRACKALLLCIYLGVYPATWLLWVGSGVVIAPSQCCLCAGADWVYYPVGVTLSGELTEG